MLTVWRVDRLGRSTAGLVLLLDDLHARGVEFRSIMDGMDTTTATGRAFYGTTRSNLRANQGRDEGGEAPGKGSRAAGRLDA